MKFANLLSGYYNVALYFYRNVTTKCRFNKFDCELKKILKKISSYLLVVWCKVL